MGAETGDKKLLTKQVNSQTCLWDWAGLKKLEFWIGCFFLRWQGVEEHFTHERFGVILELTFPHANNLTKGKCLNVFCVCLFPVQGDSEIMSDPHLTMEYKLGLHWIPFPLYKCPFLYTSIT